MDISISLWVGNTVLRHAAGRHVLVEVEAQGHKIDPQVSQESKREEVEVEKDAQEEGHEKQKRLLDRLDGS